MSLPTTTHMAEANPAELLGETSNAQRLLAMAVRNLNEDELGEMSDDDLLNRLKRVEEDIVRSVNRLRRQIDRMESTARQHAMIADLKDLLNQLEPGACPTWPALQNAVHDYCTSRLAEEVEDAESKAGWDPKP